jgi:hypothetical protein
VFAEPATRKIFAANARFALEQGDELTIEPPELFNWPESSKSTVTTLFWLSFYRSKQSSGVHCQSSSFNIKHSNRVKTCFYSSVSVFYPCHTLEAASFQKKVASVSHCSAPRTSLAWYLFET